MTLSLFTIRTDCRACGYAPLETAVSFNPLPITSPNVGIDASKRQSMGNIQVPLDLCRCPACGLLQLSATVDASFQYLNFQYVTTISVGLPEHFRQAAAETITVVGTDRVSKVLEIGSNDGTLLRAFQERGASVLGIDPAQKAASIANANGVPTIHGFFEPVTAGDILQRLGAADLVVSNNTLANIDQLGVFVDSVRQVMAPDGVFAFETSYGADVIGKMLLDTIYFEHISYFTVKPLAALFSAHGLDLYRVDAIPTKGGSIRGYVQHKGAGRPRHSSVAAFIADEERAGLYAAETYRRLSTDFNTRKEKVRRLLNEAHAKGMKIVAWGASVGCLTLISQFDIAPFIECIYDDQPLLGAMVLPEREVPVHPSRDFSDNEPVLVVILAWRYADHIITHHKESWHDGTRFLHLFPDVVLA